MLACARACLRVALRTGAPDPSPPADGPLGRPAAAFVTLRRRSDGALRGCIGRLVPAAPLGATLAAMAAAAALEDPRFPPVREEEEPALSLEVSVLGPFAAAGDPERELRVGVHGLRVDLRGRSGLLLPQVAAEHGLDGPAFLDAACRKAGLPPGAWRDPSARVELFTAEVIGPD
ncbi:MAG: AmmeMemoRadiSam system protein A [Planctomycetes bacterium]|nr:AmmeMemoRadiSam system protein A [Planctomycetota bacterium]